MIKTKHDMTVNIQDIQYIHFFSSCSKVKKMAIKSFALKGLCLVFLLLGLTSCSKKVVPAKLFTTHSGSMEVVATGFENDRGTAAFFLFNNSHGFPGQSANASKKMTAPIVDGRAVAIFEQIPYGYYAVAILHDLNDNAVMDRNLFGWPLEAHGLSRDAKGFLGPPAYEDARFGFFAERATIKIQIEHSKNIREQRRKKRQLRK